MKEEFQIAVHDISSSLGRDSIFFKLIKLDVSLYNKLSYLGSLYALKFLVHFLEALDGKDDTP